MECQSAGLLLSLSIVKWGSHGWSLSHAATPCKFLLFVTGECTLNLSEQKKKTLKTHNTPQGMSRCQSSRKSIVRCLDGKKQPHFDSLYPASLNPPRPLAYSPSLLSLLSLRLHAVCVMKVQLLCFFRWPLTVSTFRYLWVSLSENDQMSSLIWSSSLSSSSSCFTLCDWLEFEVHPSPQYRAFKYRL